MSYHTVEECEMSARLHEAAARQLVRKVQQVGSHLINTVQHRGVVTLTQHNSDLHNNLLPPASSGLPGHLLNTLDHVLVKGGRAEWLSHGGM